MRRATSPPALLVLLLFMPLLTVAQRSGIGIKGGMLASHTRSGAYSSQYIPGATVGIYAPLLGSARFELQPEVLFTALGSGHTSPEEVRYTVRTLYLQVPLSAKVYFSNVINVQAGLQASTPAEERGAPRPCQVCLFLVRTTSCVINAPQSAKPPVTC